MKLLKLLGLNLIKEKVRRKGCRGGVGREENVRRKGCRGGVEKVKKVKEE